MSENHAFPISLFLLVALGNGKKFLSQNVSFFILCAKNLQNESLMIWHCEKETEIDIQGDPNQTLTIQMAVTENFQFQSHVGFTNIWSAMHSCEVVVI